MSKSATEVVQDALFSAVVEAVIALKDNAKGMPNTIVRDVNSMHENVTFADLPEHLQKSIKESVKSALNRMRREGYSVVPTTIAVNPPKKTASTGKRRNRG